MSESLTEGDQREVGDPLTFDKGGNNRQWDKETSSISVAGKTGQLHVKE